MSEFTREEYQNHYDNITDEIKALNKKKKVWVDHVESKGFDLIKGEFVKQKK